MVVCGCWQQRWPKAGGGGQWCVGDGGQQRVVVVVVEERAGDVTVSHDQLDLAGIGL